MTSQSRLLSRYATNLAVQWTKRIVQFACAGLFVSACSSTPERMVTQVTLTDTPCPPRIQANAIEVFGAQHHLTKGWSHILKPEKAADFQGLSQPLGTYAISKQNHQFDASCQQKETFQAILVKKLHGYKNNHSNGIETQMPDLAIKQWQAIELVLKIDPEQTVIPSVDELEVTFPELAPEDIEKLDQGKINLNILFRDGELEAAHFLTLDPKTDVGRWLRLTVPTEQLAFSRKVNYVHTPLSYEDMMDQSYATVSIKAETQSKKTVQHLNQRQAPANRLFKEVSVSIHSLHLIPKQGS